MCNDGETQKHDEKKLPLTKIYAQGRVIEQGTDTRLPYSGAPSLPPAGLSGGRGSAAIAEGEEVVRLVPKLHRRSQRSPPTSHLKLSTPHSERQMLSAWLSHSLVKSQFCKDESRRKLQRQSQCGPDNRVPLVRNFRIYCENIWRLGPSCRARRASSAARVESPSAVPNPNPSVSVFGRSGTHETRPIITSALTGRCSSVSGQRASLRVSVEVNRPVNDTVIIRQRECRRLV